jgi:uroporphyrinogen-III synthase
MNHPLTGSNILVTRPEHQAHLLSVRLRDLGAFVIEIPMIEIAPPASWDDFDKAIRDLNTYDWVFFASTNAVQFFIERAKFIWPEASGDIQRMMSAVKLAAIGENTAQVLIHHGLKVDYVPPEFNAESFIRSFPRYPDLSGVRALWPRTNIGRDSIASKLTEAGCQLTIVESYRTMLPHNKDEVSRELDKLLQGHKLDLITFTSGQTARNFAEILSSSGKTTVSCNVRKDEGPIIAEQEFKNRLKNVTLVSIGPETTAAMKECGLPVCLEAKPHNAEGLVQAILQSIGNA